MGRDETWGESVGVFIFDGVKGSCLGTAGLGRVRNWPAHMASLPIS
jgi:hypothetical protein